MVTKVDLTNWAASEEEDDLAQSADGMSEDAQAADDLATKYGGFIEILETHAQELQDAVGQLDDSLFADLTQPMTPEQTLALEQVLAPLDVQVVGNMVASVQGITLEDATALAQHCVDEGYVDDAEALKNFVFRVGQLEE